MSEYGGYLFIIDEAQRASRVEGRIHAEETFTDTLSVSDWHTKQAEIFFISLNGHSIRYAALAHRGKVVATDKRQVRFTNFVELLPTVPLRQIQELLDPRIQSYFVKSSSGMGSRVTPKTWQGLMEVVKRLRPGSKKELERLETLRQMRPEFFRRPGIETLAEERDAVNLALRMSDFDKKEILKWNPPEGDDLPPFVRGLQSATLIEDQMIAHDAEVFGDWGRLKRYQVGYAVFNKGQERLTVMNVNRHNVERTLGVDLFYYHYRYDAYVMVQYKRMVKESGGAVYRLNDKSYRNELERMQEFERILKRAEPRLPYGLRDYRLHAGTSYFKLCPAEIFDLTSTDMMKGMYLPLDYWEMLIRSPEILGPQGGERITYDNVERYFTNTLFVGLVQAGWIGSRLLRTEVLTDLARSAINGNRSLLLATMVLARSA